MGKRVVRGGSKEVALYPDNIRLYGSRGIESWSVSPHALRGRRQRPTVIYDSVLGQRCVHFHAEYNSRGDDSLTETRSKA